MINDRRIVLLFYFCQRQCRRKGCAIYIYIYIYVYVIPNALSFVLAAYSGETVSRFRPVIIGVGPSEFGDSKSRGLKVYTYMFIRRIAFRRAANVVRRTAEKKKARRTTRVKNKYDGARIIAVRAIMDVSVAGRHAPSSLPRD